MSPTFSWLGISVLTGSLWLGVSDEAGGNPCAVTLPNGIVAGGAEVTAAEASRSFGNALLSLGIFRDGRVLFAPDGPGFRTSSGGLVMKFGWIVASDGKLLVRGHRLDGPAEKLAWERGAFVASSGFQATYLIFPAPGCWQIEAELSGKPDSGLSFVTSVEIEGTGPRALYDPVAPHVD